MSDPMREQFEAWVRSSARFPLTRLAPPCDDDYRDRTIAMAWHCFQNGWGRGRNELADYAGQATEALTELLRQVEAFIAENGEADFFTGQAHEVLAKNPERPQGTMADEQGDPRIGDPAFQRTETGTKPQGHETTDEVIEAVARSVRRDMAQFRDQVRKDDFYFVNRELPSDESRHQSGKNAASEQLDELLIAYGAAVRAHDRREDSAAPVLEARRAIVSFLHQVRKDALIEIHKSADGMPVGDIWTFRKLVLALEAERAEILRTVAGKKS